MPATIATFDHNGQRQNALASVLDVYVCPKCKGRLAFDDRELRCHACRRTYPVRNSIPDFIADDLQRSPSWILRHSAWFDWLAPVYETSLWYPVVIRLAGVKGIASLPALLAAVEEMMGTISGDVLDVACGPGTFGRRVAAHSTTVFGIDISPGMLEQGRAYAQRERVTSMHFARAQVEALPFAAESFAAALCCGSLHLFADSLAALREIARTLKPGARLVGVTFTGTNTRLSRFAQRHGARVFDVNNLGDILQQAGFEDYRPRTFGSALLFRAIRNHASAASGADNANAVKGAAQ